LSDGNSDCIASVNLYVANAGFGALNVKPLQIGRMIESKYRIPCPLVWGVNCTVGTVRSPTTTAALFWLGAFLLLGSPGQGQGDSPPRAKTEKQKSQDFLFEVRPREIAPGEAAVLRWSIKGAARVTIEEAPKSGTGSPELTKVGSFEGSSGMLEVRPKEDTTYVITCEGSTAYTCASATVRVRVKSH
jgi:hypothetical protein